MKRVIGLICVGAVVFGLSNHAFGWTDMAFRGEENGWGTDALTYDAASGIWRGTIGAVTGTDGTSEFKLYASDGGTWFSDASAHGLPDADTIGTDGGNMSFSQQDGYYYTFTVIDASSLTFAIQETANTPVNISSHISEVSNGGNFDPTDNYASGSVQNNANTVSITLNTAPSSGENVYIYYSTDNFASQANSDIISATGAGTSWTGVIPSQSENANIDYYILTSTFSEANLDAVAAEVDVLLRALDENSASTLEYNIYDLGDSFHIPTQTPGSPGNGDVDMLAGSGNTTATWDGTETEARIYSGNVFQGVGEAADQSSYTLNYRVNGGAWQSQAGAFNNTSGNDKYWLSTLDLTGVSSGSVVQYYLEYNYTTGEDTTYVFNNGGGSFMSGNEQNAQNTPFSFQYGQPAAGGGDSVPEPNTMSMAVLAGSLMLSWRHRIKMQRKARDAG